jgi:hypothetical protein
VVMSRTRNRSATAYRSRCSSMNVMTVAGSGR